MSDRPLLPSNLEKVADAGGWDERAAEQAMEFMKVASKIKKPQWQAMTGTLGALKDIVEVGGFEGMFDRLQENWSLQVDQALAPLNNQITDALTTILDPILPYVTDTLNEVTNLMGLGMDAIKAAMTGTWEEWLDEQTLDFQAGMDGWSDDWIDFHTAVQKWVREIEDATDQYIAFAVKIWTAITDFFSGGGTAQTVITDFGDWAEAYKLSHPNASPSDIVVAYMEYMNPTTTTPPPTTTYPGVQQ